MANQNFAKTAGFRSAGHICEVDMKLDVSDVFNMLKLLIIIQAWVLCLIYLRATGPRAHRGVSNKAKIAYYFEVLRDFEVLKDRRFWDFLEIFIASDAW